MVIFNDLRITEDKDCLIVDCYIEDIDGYAGMYIDSVYVDYYENVTTFGVPTEKAIKLYEHVDGKNDRAIRKVLKKSQLNASTFGTDTFDKGLFFITVRCDGTPTNPSILEGYSCGRDDVVDVGAALDWKSVYERGIGYAAKLADECNTCENLGGFKDFIFLWYALQLAISTCNWDEVRKLWKKIWRKKSMGAVHPALKSGCGCK